MRISVTNRREAAARADGFIETEIESLAHFKRLVQFDHSPIIFKDNYRHGNNFLSCDFLYGDIDEGITLDDFKKKFAPFHFLIATSRNHQRPKKDSPPCDRFHVYFPQKKTYTSIGELRLALESMHNQHPFLDHGAKDGARLLFGAIDTIVFENRGEEYRPALLPATLPVSSGHEFDHIKDDLTPKEHQPIFSTKDGRDKAKRLLLVQKERNRWPDMTSWMALRSALYREGFSLQDFIDLSWPGAECEKEWRNMKEGRDGAIATGGSIIAWCREVDPTFLKPGTLYVRNISEAPPDGMGRAEIETAYFDEEPSHGRASDLLFSAMRGSVIFEKHGFDRGAFYRRAEGACYWEPFETIKTEARNILERVADAMFAEKRAALGDESGDALRLLAKKYFAHLRKARTHDFLRSAIALFSERVLVSPRVPWNITPEAIPCTDKIVDFSGAKIIARDAHPWEYFINPVPCSSSDILSMEDSPRFDRFMADIFGNKETRKTAMQCLSLCVSGSPSKTAQIWNNWAGDGGKNTVFDFLRELVPGRVTMLKPAIIAAKGDSGEKRFGVASAEGKTGIFFDELSAEIDINQVKALTGLSEIKAEKKGRDQYDFQQTWSLVILCNKLPKFRPADDSAFLARLLVLPFTSVFYRDEQDRAYKIAHGVPEHSLKLADDKAKILSELMLERPAIIKKISEAWIDCRDNNNKTPLRSQECIRAAEKYRKDNDEVERFFDDYLERMPGHSITYQSLEELWVESSGNKRFNGMRWLVESLIAKYGFITRGNSGGKRVLKGIIEKRDFGESKTLGGVPDNSDPPF